MRWILPLSILSVFLSAHSLFAQEADFRPSFYNVSENGEIPSTEVYATFQDSKGNIWFCSDAGATKFDGYYYKTYTVKDGLISNVVFNVFEDSNGRIWFLSLAPQLCYLENDTIREYKYNNIIEEVVRGHTGLFKDVYIDKFQNLFYSLKGLGAIKITPEGTFSQIHENDRSVQVTKIEDIYLSSARVDPRVGIVPKKGAERWIFPIYYKDIDEFVNMGEIDPNGYFQIHDAKIAQRGLFVLGGVLFTPKGEITGIRNVLNVKIDPFNSEVVWVGTRDGLKKGRIENNTFRIENEFLHHLTITGICWDTEGAGWFSTLDAGVLYCNNFQILKAEDKYGVKDRVILGVAQTKEELFYTSREFCYKLSSDRKFPLTTGSYSKLDLWKNNLVVSGASWELAMDDGLVKLPFLRDFQIHDDFIYGVSSRVYKYDLEHMQTDTLYDGTRDTSQWRNLFFRAIQILDDGDVIIGGPHGLNLVKDKKLIRNYLNSEKLGLDVSDILYDPRWGLIIATCNKGIVIFDREGTPSYIDESLGLISNDIGCLAISNNGTLLVGTNFGLNYILCNNNYIGLLSKNLGLESQNVNTIHVGEQFAYIGTKSGMFRAGLDQFELREPQNSIRVFLEEIFVNREKRTNQGELLTLGSDVNLLRVRFRVNNFKNWFNKKYQYRLGETGSWIDISSPEIVLYRPSGTLKVEVRYNDEYNHWSEPSLLLNVDIKLPIWKRWYFWLTCTIFTTLGVFLWFKRRQGIVKRELQLKNELLSLEQRMHSARMNPHFIFNVLNSIQGFMMFNENEQAEKYLIKFSALMRKVLDNSGDGQIFLTHEIEIIDKYLELERLRSNEAFDYELITPNGQRDYLIPTMLIQPIVENAIIHGIDIRGKRGKIVVKFEIVGIRALRVTVFNNKEMSAEQLGKVKNSSEMNALGLTKSRLQNFCHLTRDNQFRIEFFGSFEGMLGTAVIVTLPILKG